MTAWSSIELGLRERWERQPQQICKTKADLIAEWKLILSSDLVRSLREMVEDGWTSVVRMSK